MKKLLVLPAAILPYMIFISVVCMFYSGTKPVLFLFTAAITAVLFPVSALCNVVYVVMLRKESELKAIKAALILKLVQVPAYVGIFCLGLMCMLTIFTIPVILVLSALDFVSLCICNVISLPAIVKCRKSQMISKSTFVISSIVQFVFCLDIISIFAIYIKTKKQKLIIEE